VQPAPGAGSGQEEAAAGRGVHQYHEAGRGREP
jgi:hypothetical protein